MYAGTFATNEGSKIFRFPAPEETVYFDGCDSEFDTIFTIYTEQQYLSGDEYNYTAYNDDAGSTHCYGGDNYFASHITLPYDSNYDGDYYLVVRPFSSYSVTTDSHLAIYYVCDIETDWYYYDDWYYSWTPSPTYVQYK